MQISSGNRRKSKSFLRYDVQTTNPDRSFLRYLLIFSGDWTKLQNSVLLLFLQAKRNNVKNCKTK